MSVHVWRLSDDRYAATLWSGTGARDSGGRWNSKGTAVAYASQSRSLAALEQLAQMIGRRILSGYVFGSIELAENQIEVIAATSLPSNWADGVARIDSRLFGDRWVLEGRTLALRVPSKVMPGEFNYLINPVHRDFAAAPKSKPIPYIHDPRLA